MVANAYGILLILTVLQVSRGDLTEYFSGVASYFGYNQQSTEVQEGFDQRIPYEVSVEDEKFISHAIQLTGTAASELDKCQHRVVLKLHSDCNAMNDEMLSKMAVALLNCQSYVEGRQVYPCTEQMSIKQCTSGMDGDAWNSYHLMSNRVRAVCYSIRQVQFRGSTEHTINRLIDTAKDQLMTLGKIAEDQENLRRIARDTLKSVTDGQAELIEQQNDIHKAQLFGQMALENNIRRLGDEKKLISESQEQLTVMTQSMREKLDEASEQIQHQATETNEKHKQLLEDLIAIREKAQIIFQKIDDSSDLLMKQSQIAQQQYEQTLKQLMEVNSTVHSLVSLVGGTKQALEERLAWLTESIGGTDDAIERLYLILWHSGFLLLVMIGCAFLGARTSTRLAVVVLVPSNLILAINKFEQAADPLNLSITLIAYILVQTVFLSIHSFTQKKSGGALAWKKTPTITRSKSATPERPLTPYNHNNNAEETRSELNVTSTYKSPHHEYEGYDSVDNYLSKIPEDFLSPSSSLRGDFNLSSRSRSRTPLHINGAKASCKAKTRMGTPCKLSSVPGRDFCFRHQKGDSVIG